MESELPAFDAPQAAPYIVDRRQSADFQRLDSNARPVIRYSDAVIAQPPLAAIPSGSFFQDPTTGQMILVPSDHGVVGVGVGAGVGMFEAGAVVPAHENHPSNGSFYGGPEPRRRSTYAERGQPDPPSDARPAVEGIDMPQYPSYGSVPASGPGFYGDAGQSPAPMLQRKGTLRGGVNQDGNVAADNNGAVPEPYTPYFCYLIFVANVIMFVVSIGVNGWKFEPVSVNPMIGPSALTLEQLGAVNAILILRGQWWRFVTPMFLHAGFIHLAMNMMVLMNLGRNMEQAFGWKRVSLIYFVSGVSGNIASAIFLPDVLDVGASGALYGLIGALYGDFFQNHKMMVDGKCRYMAELIFSSILGLAMGLFPLVDNFCHVGGFLCGIMCGSALLKPSRRSEIERQNVTCYGEALSYCAYVLIVIWFIVGFVVLYEAVDANRACSWCHYISCVPSPWWSCNTVPQCQFTQTINGTSTTYTAACPTPPP